MAAQDETVCAGEERREWRVEDTSVERLDLSQICTDGDKKFAVVLHGVLTPEECEELIERSEREGYSKALINTGASQKLITDVRNSDRCIIDDPSTAEFMHQRVLQVLARDEHQTSEATSTRHVTFDSSPRARFVNPPWVGNMGEKKTSKYNAVGLNERLRFLKYDAGCFFAPHFDGQYRRPTDALDNRFGERSFVTFQLYLNDGFEGGYTSFLTPDETIRVDVVPRTGSVLLFEHMLLHEGGMLVEGRKYALRTDVMYSLKPNVEYSKRPIVLPEKECERTPKNDMSVAALLEREAEVHGDTAAAKGPSKVNALGWGDRSTRQANAFRPQSAETQAAASAAVERTLLQRIGAFITGGGGEGGGGGGRA